MYTFLPPLRVSPSEIKVFWDKLSFKFKNSARINFVKNDELLGGSDE